MGRTSLAVCWISVVILLKIRQGIELVTRKDEKFAVILEHWLRDRVKPSFGSRTLLVTPTVAERAGRIAAVRTRGLADCIIAATALEYHLTLATRNIADFDDIEGLQIINPWDHQSEPC